MSMLPLDTASRQIRISNAVMPKEGARVVPLVFDFSLAASFVADFYTASQQQQISAIQAVFIDNSASAGQTTLTVQGTGETVIAPAYSQGVYPIAAAVHPRVTVSNGGASTVTILFFNVPLPASVWLVSNLAPPPFAVTAKNPAASSVVTGGTAVTVFAAGAITGGGFIANPLNATESLWLDLVNVPGTTAPGASGTTVEIPIGGSFTIPAGLSNAVRINAVTAGHAFTAVSW